MQRVVILLLIFCLLPLSADSLKKRAKNGDADAQYELAMKYRSKKGKYGEYERLMSMAANSGHAEANFKKGCDYNVLFRGSNKDKRLFEKGHLSAFTYFEKAHKLGHPDALISMVGMYYIIYYKQRLPIPTSDSSFIPLVKQCLVKLSNKTNEKVYCGSRRANISTDSLKSWIMYELGNSYLNGYGVQQNYNKALNWFRQAEEQGYDQAKHMVDVIGQKLESNAAGTSILTWVNKMKLDTIDLYIYADRISHNLHVKETVVLQEQARGRGRYRNNRFAYGTHVRLAPRDSHTIVTNMLNSKCYYFAETKNSYWGTIAWSNSFPTKSNNKSESYPLPFSEVYNKQTQPGTTDSTKFINYGTIELSESSYDRYYKNAKIQLVNHCPVDLEVSTLDKIVGYFEPIKFYLPQGDTSKVLHYGLENTFKVAAFSEGGGSIGTKSPSYYGYGRPGNTSKENNYAKEKFLRQAKISQSIPSFLMYRKQPAIIPLGGTTEQ